MLTLSPVGVYPTSHDVFVNISIIATEYDEYKILIQTNIRIYSYHKTQYKQACKLQDAQAEKLISLKANIQEVADSYEPPKQTAKKVVYAKSEEQTLDQLLSPKHLDFFWT